MIAEAAIVGMFLYGHDLNAVVAVGNDSGQHVFSEFVVGAHLFGILSHADVALVDEQRRGAGLEILFTPNERLFWMPHLRREDAGLLVLHHTAAPSRNAFAHSTVPIHVHFIQITVLQRRMRKHQFPVTRFGNTLHLIRLCFRPFIEIAH